MGTVCDKVWKPYRQHVMTHRGYTTIHFIYRSSDKCGRSLFLALASYSQLCVCVDECEQTFLRAERGRRRVCCRVRRSKHIVAVKCCSTLCSPCPVSQHMLQHVWGALPEVYAKLDACFLICRSVQNVTKVFFYQFTVQAVKIPPSKTEEISSSPKRVDNSTSQRTQHTGWVVNCHERHIFRGLETFKSSLEQQKKLNLWFFSRYNEAVCTLLAVGHFALKECLKIRT